MNQPKLETGFHSNPKERQCPRMLELSHNCTHGDFTFTFLFHALEGCLENPRDGRAWWAAVYGVAQSWTRLK